MAFLEATPLPWYFRKNLLIDSLQDMLNFCGCFFLCVCVLGDESVSVPDRSFVFAAKLHTFTLLIGYLQREDHTKEHFIVFFGRI